jgi:predicted HNH restriction endonuclease
MLDPNPKERIGLQAIMKHAWTNGESASREDYKKEMTARVKKVMVKVRKEQELEMKQAFMREKDKREADKREVEVADSFPFQLRRDLEEQVLQLRGQIAGRDHSGSSLSDSSSLEENEGEEGKGGKVAKLEVRRSAGSAEGEDHTRA